MSDLTDIVNPSPTGSLGCKLQGAWALLKARAALLDSRITHDRVFRHLADDVWFSVNTSAYRRFPVLRRLLPSLPDEQVQIAFIGSAGDTALLEAFRFYQIIRAIAARANRSITRQTIVLDFGCGWGRMLRFFMRDVPVSQLHGADVMPRSIELCHETNPWCQFSLVPPLPPSAFPSARFDVIYLYSVFSHLSEEAHARWLEEFHRLLAPRGLLFATTWPREYIELCARARDGDTRGTHPGSLDAFIGTGSWLAQYDAGQFCHSPVGGGDALAKDFYGESCIPEAYVRRCWEPRFRTVHYIEADGTWLWQNLIVAERQ
jgi:SAM-dependent methyltransferase